MRVVIYDFGARRQRGRARVVMNWGKDMSIVSRSACVATLLMLLSPLGGRPAVQDSSLPWQPPVRFRAYAVGGGLSSMTATDLVQIVIERWSTDEEQAKVLDALAAGDASLLRTLQDVKLRVGYVRYLRSDESMPRDEAHFNLTYATPLPDSDGTTRALLMAAGNGLPGRVREQFTVIEMRFGKDGVGEGRMAQATMESAGGKKVLLTRPDYRSRPVAFQWIRKE